MLLKVKESEVEFLHKDISCLRKEVQTLTKVQRLCVNPAWNLKEYYSLSLYMFLVLL